MRDGGRKGTPLTFPPLIHSTKEGIFSSSLPPSFIPNIVSGVLDIHKWHVTHIHCPPPHWLDGLNDSANLLSLRRPSWLPDYSIYAVGSPSNNGIHLLDFYPDSSAPCHVDYNEDLNSIHEENNSQHKQNRFVPLVESVTACAAHPRNSTIIAGTKQSSLLMISQRHHSLRGGDKSPEQ